ncbi:MAG: PstS family phosphate ABC transporter substrate-binding protein [Gemmatales bacterium]|nr:PstS family phosphate ABC transporter substrate-binding protein [Gemmatales bacterium]MDW8222428.1 PstS family phosphate ABC transporter substrate-binding protein [Gemmatales bacterium]
MAKRILHAGIGASVAVLLALGVLHSQQQLTGEIKADGSSTTYLITERMATAFRSIHPKVQISIGVSGTGGGFKKFANNETDISNASRAIRPAEAELCRKNGIEFLELKVALDGLAVIVNPENTWARKLTVEQLQHIWRPDNPARRWSDLDPNWPNERIELFGPGTDSGTFDYFTEAINGKEKVSRADYNASEDDNVIVNGVARSKYALGYLGLAYYEENRERLTAVAIRDREGKDFYLPTRENVLKGVYKPLSRPLFIYVKLASMKRPEVREFVRFYLRRSDLVRKSGYIELPIAERLEQQERFEKALAEMGLR